MNRKAANETLRLSSEGKRTNAGNALDGNLPNSFLETGESRVDFPDLSLLPLYQLLDDLRGGSSGIEAHSNHFNRLFKKQK